MSLKTWSHWKTEAHPASAKIWQFNDGTIKGAIEEEAPKVFTSIDSALRHLCSLNPALSPYLQDWSLTELNENDEDEGGN
jgi:hypothetical protein